MTCAIWATDACKTGLRGLLITWPSLAARPSWTLLDVTQDLRFLLIIKAALSVAAGAGLGGHQDAEVTVAGGDDEGHIRGVQMEAVRATVGGVPGCQRLEADPLCRCKDFWRLSVAPVEHLRES